MGAYNRVNGEPACANTELMRILRDEWGFEGYFVSDCWAIQDFHMHHKVTSNFIESAALALTKGCDVNCGCSYAYILQAYNEGMVTEAEINRSVEKLFETRLKLGLFDKTYLDNIPYDVVDCEEHNAVSLEAAEKSMVLLKNDGILPLDKSSIDSIAVIGCNADSREALKGNYYGTASSYTTFLQGIKEACGKEIRVHYSEGCDFIKDKCEGLAQPDDRISEAIICAEQSDVTILCVGLNEHIEGEEGDTGNEYASGDKQSLLLPESQRRLIKAVLDTGKPVIIVLAAGSSVTLGDDRENALICTWYAGARGGTALAEIIFGEISPSGKLPVTFYKDTDKLPEFTDYSMKNRTYRYIENDDNVLYPFGYGLTYSEFECRIISVDGDVVTVEAENTGSFDSGEVIQLYKDVTKGNPKLCGIKRIFLTAGECAKFEIKAEISDGDKLYCGFGQPEKD